MERLKVGVVGQGVVGGAISNDLEERGFDIVRYSLEPQYISNGSLIGTCDIVVIAVPTPTYNDTGFDNSAVINALSKVSDGKVAVIRSTMKIGASEKLQEMFPNLYVFYVPEFLVARNAKSGAKRPDRNIIGYTKKGIDRPEPVDMVKAILPDAPAMIVTSREAELIKYACNCFLYTKLMFANVLYELCEAYEIDYDTLKAGMTMDSRIGKSHLDPVFEGGRGAGGTCFVKDFATFSDMCEIASRPAQEFTKAIEMYNYHLLLSSGKDRDILDKVYRRPLSIYH